MQTARDASRQGATMMSTFALLMQRCGLSQRETAEMLEVRLDTVKSWSSGRNPVRLAVVNELRVLYQKIERAGLSLCDTAQMTIDHQRKISGEPVLLEFGLAQSDAEARQLGFPCIGAHAAALGVAIANLSDDVDVDIVPRRRGDTLTAIVDWKKPTASAAMELSRARKQREQLEKKLHNEREDFAIYLATAPSEGRTWLEAELRQNDSFRKWLALGRTIEKLETTG
jgi:hypothetical protein